MAILRKVWILGMIALLSGASPLGTNDPVAVLVQVSGDVRVQRSGAGAAAPAAVGAQLAAGDAVVVSGQGRAVLLYRSGRVQAVTESVRVAAEEGGRAGMFEQATRTLAQIATTDAKAQPNRQGMIRPIAGAAVPISPRNGHPVLSMWPTFVWFAVAGADGYQLNISEEGIRPLRVHVGADTVWTLPDSLRLTAGATYVWTVGADGKGRVAPQQRFRTATSAERSALRDRIGAISDAGLDPEADGLFLAALIYHDAGFVYEADRALARMEEMGNGSGSTFFTLRGSVHDALGRLDSAATAFERAALSKQP